MVELAAIAVNFPQHRTVCEFRRRRAGRAARPDGMNAAGGLRLRDGQAERRATRTSRSGPRRTSSGEIDSSDYKTYIFGLLFPETAVRSAGQGTTDSGSEGVTFLCTSCRDFDDLLDHPRCGLPLHHQPALVHAVFGDYVPKLFEVQ